MGAWVPFGATLLLLGAWRLVVAYRIYFEDTFYSCLAILPAGLLVLVFDYVLHHAKLVSIMVFIMAGILAYSFPVLNVALGLTFMGAIAGSLLSDWKDENRLRKSPTPPASENEASQYPLRTQRPRLVY